MCSLKRTRFIEVHGEQFDILRTSQGAYVATIRHDEETQISQKIAQLGIQPG